MSAKRKLGVYYRVSDAGGAEKGSVRFEINSTEDSVGLVRTNVDVNAGRSSLGVDAQREPSRSRLRS